MSNLFQSGVFTLHSGGRSAWKIECEALTPEDLDTFARLIASHVGPFAAVEGVPRGGLALAAALERFAADYGPTLIVDDVYTTGASMRQQAAGREYVRGVVLFARGPIKEPWVEAVFTWTLGGRQ